MMGLDFGYSNCSVDCSLPSTCQWYVQHHIHQNQQITHRSIITTKLWYSKPSQISYSPNSTYHSHQTNVSYSPKSMTYLVIYKILHQGLMIKLSPLSIRAFNHPRWLFGAGFLHPPNCWHLSKHLRTSKGIQVIILCLFSAAGEASVGGGFPKKTPGGN